MPSAICFNSDQSKILSSVLGKCISSLHCSKETHHHITLFWIYKNLVCQTSNWSTKYNGSLTPKKLAISNTFSAFARELQRPSCIVTSCRCISSLPYNPDFQRPWESSLLKTLWEKEKMLVTSIFSFSHIVFYPSQIKFPFFGHIYFVVCKCFEFGLVKNFVVWERVPFSKSMVHIQLG